MTPLEIGLIGCLAMLVLLALSMPVAFAMAIIGFTGFAWLVNPKAAMSMVSKDLYTAFSSSTLTVIPLFTLMGQVCFHAGISSRLFDAAYKWLSRLPGGMAIATVGACTAFGAICGSGPATAATMASVVLPEMKKYKYDMALATGAVAAGGSLGMLIPPSVVFIVYALLTEQSIGDLFIAGIMPGLMIALLFSISIFISCVRRPEAGPVGPKFTMKEKFRSLLGVTETLLLFVLVIGGMFSGLFTATEAASVGAAGAIVIAAVRGRCTIKMLKRSLFETLRTSCMVIMIVAGATVFGHFLAISQLPADLADWLAGLPMPGWVIIGLIILFYLIAGCFIDALALIILTTPIFYPVIRQLGYDLVWFGVILVVVTQMGVISPPVGVNVYVVSGIERDVPLQTIFKGVLPFLFMLLVAAVLLIMFPQIALWLPGMTK